MSVSEENRRNFVEHGYFVHHRTLPPDVLEALRAEADLAVAWQDEELRKNAADAQDVTHAGRRYFLPFRSREREALRAFAASELMAEICEATVGGDAWLFCEMFVVKSPSVGLPFGWHQDSGYLDYFKHGDFPAYVTIWMALDDMTEDNGTLYVMPFSEGGSRVLVEHHLEEGTNDKIADFGPHPGHPVVVPAGSIVVLSSLVPHRSGPNRSGRPRAAYLCQYSPAPILHADGRAPVLLAEPFLRDGQRIA